MSKKKASRHPKPVQGSKKKIQLYETRGTKWITDTAGRKSRGGRSWVKHIKSINDLNIHGQRDGYALTASFRNIDARVQMREGEFLVVASQDPRRTFNGKPWYDTRLIGCKSGGCYVVTEPGMRRSVVELYEQKKISQPQKQAATNPFYLMALYCFGNIGKVPGEDDIVERFSDPLDAITKKKKRRRITRAVPPKGTNEEPEDDDDEFHPSIE